MESSARAQDLPGSGPTISGTHPAQFRAGVCLRPEAAFTGRSCPLRRLSLGLALGRRLLGTAQLRDGLAHALSLRLELSQVRLELGDPLLARPEAPLEAALVTPTVAGAAAIAAATAAVVAAAGALALVVVTVVVPTAAPTPVFVAVPVALTAPAALTLAVMMTLAHRTTSLTDSAIFPQRGVAISLKPPRPGYFSIWP